jgi:nitrite reductase (NAD(P)H)
MEESEPIHTPGLEPTSMQLQSPPGSPPQNPTWGDKKEAKDPKLPVGQLNDPEIKRLPGKMEEAEEEHVPDVNNEAKRKRVVVVGLGMVGIAFM